MKLYTVTFAVFLLHEVSTAVIQIENEVPLKTNGNLAADIHAEKEAAFKTMEGRVENLKQLRAKMDETVNLNTGKINQIYTHVMNQGERVENHNLFEIRDEAKLYYIRADILNSQLKVHLCISKAVNAGEVIIEKDYELFKEKGTKEYSEVNKKQQADMDLWKKDIKALETSFESEHQSIARKIFEATQSAEIKNLLQKFEGISKEFEVRINSIGKMLAQSQNNYLIISQTSIHNLRAKMIAEKNKVFQELEKCIPKNAI